MESGIYTIINNLNGYFYIGSAKNYIKRWERHKNDLKRNKHDNAHLQRSYKKHGAESFSYHLIEECEVENLLKVEQLYLDKYVMLKECYNIGLKSCGGDNLTNHPDKAKIKKKISDSLYLFYSKLSEQERYLLLGDRKGINNSNFGNNWTKEMREKASKRTLEYFKNNEHCFKNKSFEEIFGEEKANEIKLKISNHAKERTGDKNSFYGKRHSEKTKEKIRKSREGKYHGTQNISFTIEGIKYNSLGDASKKLNIPITTIRWRLKSNNIKFIDYKYKRDD